METTWKNRAESSIAHGALTNSKRPECFVKGVYDTHASSARGPFLYDSRGHQLIDFICANGSCILGYGNRLVAERKYQQDIQGSTLSLSSTIEVQLAEKIKELVPWIDLVRFLKSGSDVCTASLRVARAYTGRKTILSDGYHGFHDEFVSLTEPHLGVLANEYIRKFEDLDQIDDSIAGVIVEPIITDFSLARREFLKKLRDKCTHHNVLLIFDEVITGFRVPKFTISNYLGIEPDLILLGKAMANGAAISCIGGKKHFMNPDWFISSTFAGETAPIAAALACIEQLQTNKFNLQELWERGERFQNIFNALYPEKIKIKGYPTRGVFEGDPLTKALLWQEAYKAGILFGASFFFNFAHIPYVDQTLSTIQDILTRIKTGQVKLEGEMPKIAFAQKQREAK